MALGLVCRSVDPGLRDCQRRQLRIVACACSRLCRRLWRYVAPPRHDAGLTEPSTRRGDAGVFGPRSSRHGGQQAVIQIFDNRGEGHWPTRAPPSILSKVLTPRVGETMRALLLIMSLAATCPVMSCAWVAPMGRRHGTLIEYRWAQGDDRSPPGPSHQVGDTVVLGLDGIDHAEVRPFRIGGDSAWSVIVRLTPPAATAFADATAAHVGRTIVVLMHDRIV